jgi:hypothetical protein
VTNNGQLVVGSKDDDVSFDSDDDKDIGDADVDGVEVPESTTLIILPLHLQKSKVRNKLSATANECYPCWMLYSITLSLKIGVVVILSMIQFNRMSIT